MKMTLLTLVIWMKFSDIVIGCFWKLYFKFHYKMCNLQKNMTFLVCCVSFFAECNTKSLLNHLQADRFGKKFLRMLFGASSNYHPQPEGSSPPSFEKNWHPCQCLILQDYDIKIERTRNMAKADTMNAHWAVKAVGGQNLRQI